MNKDDLSSKLDSIQTPKIDLPDYRDTLKASLLAKGLPQRPGWLRGMKRYFLTGLFSRQPVWKTGIAILVLAGIAVPLSLFLPNGNPDSVYASAMNIVESSINLQKMLNASDNQSIISGNYTKNYVITTDYKDGSVIVTFPAIDGKEIVPGEIKVESYDEDGNPVQIAPGVATVYIKVDEAGKWKTIRVTFTSDMEKTP